MLVEKGLGGVLGGLREWCEKKEKEKKKNLLSLNIWLSLLACWLTCLLVSLIPSTRGDSIYLIFSGVSNSFLVCVVY